jgi:NO-binding membrane sensor protein with MHYT domain
MKYHNNIVYLSYAISFLGSYMTICLCEQLRLFFLRGGQDTREKFKWFVLMGISLGGVGIWCMHFIGMSAMKVEMQSTTGQPIEIFFSIPMTLFSLIISIITTGLGIYVMSYDRLFAKSKTEILETFCDDLKHLSIPELKRIKNYTVMKLTLTKHMEYLLGGGVITGGGVCIMHYTGMAAVNFPGKIVWNWGIIAASLVIAIIAATAAFWILFRLLSIYPKKESLRIASALIMGVAVCGMHYTGMAAARFEFDHIIDGKVNAANIHHPSSSSFFSNNTMEIPTIMTSMVVLWVFVVVIMEDLRKNAQKYQTHFRKSNPQQQGLQLSSYRSPESSFFRYDGTSSVQGERPTSPNSTTRATGMRTARIAPVSTTTNNNAHGAPRVFPSASTLTSCNEDGLDGPPSMHRTTLSGIKPIDVMSDVSNMELLSADEKSAV